MFFGEISLIGPLVNLVAIPLFNLVLVPLTLLATLVVQVDALAATVAPPLLHAVGWLAAQTVAGLHALASAPFAALAVPAPPPATVALAACGVALALPAHPLPGRRLGWLAVLPMFSPAPAAPAPGDARVVVLDVGQGARGQRRDPLASALVRRRPRASARASTAARISSCPRLRPIGRACSTG